MSNQALRNNKRFMKLFKYEVNNRMMALIGIKKLAKKTQGSDPGPFWQAYADLEDVNQRMFAPVAKQLSVSMDITFSQRALATAWMVFSTLFPNYALKTICQQTLDYVADLEEMQKLAGDYEAEFFQFVVEQEKVQAQGMVFLVEEKFEQASKIMTDFLQAHKQLQAA